MIEVIKKYKAAAVTAEVSALIKFSSDPDLLEERHVCYWT